MFGHEACNNKIEMRKALQSPQDNDRKEPGFGEHRTRPFRTLLGVTNPTHDRGHEPINTNCHLEIIIAWGIADRIGFQCGQSPTRPIRTGIGLYGRFGDDDRVFSISFFLLVES